jgi:ribosomal protein S27AE
MEPSFTSLGPLMPYLGREEKKTPKKGVCSNCGNRYSFGGRALRRLKERRKEPKCSRCGQVIATSFTF